MWGSVDNVFGWTRLKRVEYFLWVMKLRWFGLVLLLVSLVLGYIILADVKTFERVRYPVLVDQPVDVPPKNSTEGWVGFNITLPHQGRRGYEVYGVIVSNEEGWEPSVGMAVVNGTGLWMLQEGFFSEAVWNTTKVYASAVLDKNNPYDRFEFEGVDGSEKYFFIFRGLKNGTRSHSILIGLKEAWYEGRDLLEPSPLNLSLVLLVILVGLYSIIKNPSL